MHGEVKALVQSKDDQTIHALVQSKNDQTIHAAQLFASAFHHGHKGQQTDLTAVYITLIHADNVRGVGK